MGDSGITPPHPSEPLPISLPPLKRRDLLSTIAIVPLEGLLPMGIYPGHLLPLDLYLLVQGNASLTQLLL